MVTLFVCIVLLLLAAPAHAMHISEGVLSGPVLAGGWALSAVGVGLGLKRLDYDRLMTVAILSAAFRVTEKAVALDAVTLAVVSV